MKNLSIRSIFNKDMFPSEDQCCVYQLINKKGVVFYVGQSTNLTTRISSHISTYGGDLDRFSYEVVDAKNLNNAEAYRIVELSPELNKELPPNDLFVTKSNMKSCLIEIVTDFIKSIESDIEFSESKSLGRKYISTEKLMESEVAVTNALIDCKATIDSYVKLKRCLCTGN